MQLKSNMEDDIINFTKQEVENKHAIKDFDRIISDIKQDREKRAMDQKHKQEMLYSEALASKNKH